MINRETIKLIFIFFVIFGTGFIVLSLVTSSIKIVAFSYVITLAIGLFIISVFWIADKIFDKK